MLVLLWAVAHGLGAVAPEIARDFVARMRRTAGLLLIARALHRMRMPLRRLRPHTHLLRSRLEVTGRRILGGAFRRAIRARGLVAQAKAIADLLADAEMWIARLTRRRLSRLAPRITALDASRITLPLRAHAAVGALDST